VFRWRQPDGVVYKFLWVLKILNFSSKSKGFSLRFYQKCQFATKTDQNFVFLNHEAYVPDRLHIIVLYIIFMCFKKI
jgi:hypothetical protein